MSDTRDLAKIPLEVSPKPATGKYFVLMIAVDHYTQDATNPEISLKPLHNPVLDASNVLEVLRDKYDLGIPDTSQAQDLRLTDPNRYGNYKNPLWVFNSPQVKCLYNEAARKGEINKAIKAVFAAMGPDDAFLIYFAGHGVEDGNLGYILAGNAVKDDEKTGWVSHSEIYALFNDYNAVPQCRDLLLILDCCHAAEITSGKQPITDNKNYFSRKVVMSCGADRLASDGEPGAGSPFANAFIGLLKENQRKNLRISDFYSDLNAKVGQLTFGEQTVFYDSLPVNQKGLDEFILPLKTAVADAIPVRNLATSLIQHLNFDKQKTSFRDYLPTLVERDFHVLSTSAYNFEVQLLLRKVLVEYSKGHSLMDHSDQISIAPDSTPDGNFWDALQKSLSKDQLTREINKADIIKGIVDRLYVEPEFSNKSFIITVGFQTGIDTVMVQLQEFSKDFMSLVEKEKAKREHKHFAKLFLMLSEMTPGESKFQLKDTMVVTEGMSFGMVALDQVMNKHINIFGFGDWLNNSKSLLGQQGDLLRSQDFFSSNTEKHEIMHLIQSVAQKLSVNKEQLFNNLGIIKS